MLTAPESTGADDVFLYHPHYTGIAKLSGINDWHLLVVNVGPPVPEACRIGKGRPSVARPPRGPTVIMDQFTNSQRYWLDGIVEKLAAPRDDVVSRALRG